VTVVPIHEETDAPVSERHVLPVPQAAQRRSRGPQIRPPDFCPLCAVPGRPPREKANQEAGLLICTRDGKHLFRPGADDIEKVAR
jgi:hypothetical protein